MKLPSARGAITFAIGTIAVMALVGYARSTESGQKYLPAFLL